MHAYKKLLTTTLFIISSLLLSLTNLAFANDGKPQQDYKLHAGDTVFINVADENEFTRQVVLNNTGSFNYPYLGNVDAAGLTVEQLQQKLLNALKPNYLTNPNIQVNLTQYHGIFVTGEVTNPGQYGFRQNLTVLQAISLAGGFNARADTKRVMLIRSETDDAIEVKLNAALNPGDTIKVNKGSVFF